MADTEKKEPTPAEEAASEEVMGTTEAIFGKEEEPTPAPAPPAEEAAPEPEEQAPAPEEPTPEPETGLSLDEFGDKMIMTKVDGVEKEVSLRDIVKGYQTDQYLSRKGQKVGDDLKELKAAKITPALVPETPPEDDEDPYIAGQVKPVADDVASLRKELADMTEVLRPVQYKQTLEKVDAFLKTKGYGDFMAYVPRIKSEILHLPVEEQVEADTVAFAISTYKDLKIQDMKKPAEPAKPEGRPEPVLTPPIEGGGGTPAGVDDSAAIYQAAVNKARDTGDWSHVYALKGI